MGIATYGTRHAQAFLGSLGRLARSPFGTFLTVLVVGLALALPLALELLVANASTATGGFADAVGISVYFKQSAPLEKVRQLAKSTRARPGVAQVTVVSAEDALKEFRQYSGFGIALQALDDNPLPNVLHIRPAPEARSPAEIRALERYLTAWPEVETVQVDSAWVERLEAILDVLRHVLLAAAALLGLGVLAMIGNTVRLEIENRRAEIEVVKLVGGSNSFVRRPLLYTGVLYGVAGGLIAWAFIAVAVLWLQAPVATLARLYGSRFALAGPAPPEIAWLIGGGAALGWLGAWLSATRHLYRIQPRA
ncbi:MAG TPA: permease-like cell division protein FtsX [Steroidobacteraceae bacterium]|nr:permease-like cell division protein FtsX [Steroidobacteraceae bacterium]